MNSKGGTGNDGVEVDSISSLVDPDHRLFLFNR